MIWSARPFAPAPGTMLCRRTEIADGQGKEFVFGHGKRAFRMFVVRRGDVVRGYVNICPHFQLPLNYHPDRFLTADGTLIKCSQHLALFRFEDGLCVEGACEGDRLDPLPVRLQEDRVVVGDTI